MLCLEYLWGQSGVGLKPGSLWFLKVVGTAFEDRSAASPLSMVKISVEWLNLSYRRGQGGHRVFLSFRYAYIIVPISVVFVLFGGDERWR